MIQYYRRGEHMDDHNIDRKNNRKISVLFRHHYPESEVRVAGNTLYLNLYKNQLQVQNFQVNERG